MDGGKNKMLHQILSDHHPGTFSKTEKKGWLPLNNSLKMEKDYKENVNLYFIKKSKRIMK